MIKILKVHGSLNQFILLDQTQLQQKLTQQQLKNLLNLSVKSPNLGVVDGLLVVDQARDHKALASMEIFNADGSKALMCGNGLRTVARYLSDKYHKDQFLVQTAQKTLQVRRTVDLYEQVPAFSVEISPVSFSPRDVGATNLIAQPLQNTPVKGFSKHLLFTALSVPNPHLISFVPDSKKAKELLITLGTKLNEPNPYFPDGINISFAQILADNTLFVQTFERGVGLTNACGTGMSATSLAFAINYPHLVNTNEPITVYNPGGQVQVRIHQKMHDYWLELIGNATIMGTLAISENKLQKLRIEDQLGNLQFTKEITAYQKWQLQVQKDLKKYV